MVDDVEQVVIELVGRHLPGHAGTLSSDSDLAELGMRSMTIVALLVAVEARLGARFPTDAIGQDTFRTPATIAAALRSAGGQPAT
nr:phosphopantetheine-binding protein [Kibdelosporangium sp. MJ126-NF4]CEL13401.1 hypothetical protein [Kibdelosporangium sp. MJ126-NF4]CTQ99090.1 hypothetical protein [Kibdelosporangium sp. MJ126-NF4]